MSHESRIVDPFAFARDGRELRVSSPVTELSRVLESAPGSTEMVQWVFRGEQDRDGKLFLVVEADGVLQLQCQRCLDSMAWPFSVSSRLLLVREDQELPDDLEEDDFDAVQLPASLDLRDLLEDEILLALPIAPRHDACGAPGDARDASVDSPFAALAALRGGKV